LSGRDQFRRVDATDIGFEQLWPSLAMHFGREAFVVGDQDHQRMWISGSPFAAVVTHMAIERGLVRGPRQFFAVT
jgi:hypothetical protein